VSKDLKSKTFSQLEDLVVEMGHKKYLARYIFNFIQTKGTAEVSAITPLSKSFRSELTGRGYYTSGLVLLDKLTDPDGTVKYLFGLPDGERIESVLLSDDGRRTLCVSTQVGCAMRCVFCATGRLGLMRNLTAGEIVEQVNLVGMNARITNVVFMGMGEPFENYDAVLDSVRILNHPAGRKIGIRRITISTFGHIEGIERLAAEDVQPRLAVSLNAPTDAIRKRLMPSAESLDRLLKAVRVYQQKTHNRVTFEYCLIQGVNDTLLHARLLAKRLRGMKCNVNLIEYNPHLGCSFGPSSRDVIERFERVLTESGLETTIRLKMGQTINAACGQLGTSLKLKS